MYCNDCHHLYADEFPDFEVLSTDNNFQTDVEYSTKAQFFPYYSRILSKLANYTTGNDLLEVGLGGCECVLAAREMGYNVYGIDISEDCVSKANKYEVEAVQHDFIKYDTDKQWDIIILGDVIEHVSDPVEAIEKLYLLLKDDGVIWLSTPNFDSAFSFYKGHNDPMRIEAAHKNYFSRSSLFKLLEGCNLVPVDYQISGHYNGSMEIVIVKDCYNQQ